MSSLESSQPSLDWDTICAQYEGNNQNQQNTEHFIILLKK